jgi:hypothetical protein
MVCYARPASRLAVLLIGALLVFGRPVSHFLDTAAFLVVATVVTGGTAIAAAMVLAAFASTRRRRAVAGGCVNCQFRCQQAMTEPSRPSGRPWLVTLVDRTDHAPRPGLASHAARPGAAGHSGRTERWPVQARLASPSGLPTTPVLLPMPSVRPAETAPRWPDRPLHDAGVVPWYASAP